MTSPRDKRIGLEAAAWVVKFDGVAFDTGDIARFRRWLAKSSDHRAAFETASRTWNRLDLLSKLESVELPSSERRWLDRRAVLAGAGVSAIALAVGGYALLSAPPALAFETGIGEVRDVVLADGTSIAMNASTRIEARIDADHRSVRVVRGEALFSIAPRDGTPLSILTPKGGVEAADGQVLIKVHGGGARVSLLSGAGRAWRAGLTSGARVAVEPMSEIELGQGDLSVVRVASPVLSRRTLWREGRLAFDDTPLSEAVGDVARQTGATFSFADPALADLRVGGLIEARDLDGFLSMLHENLAIDAHRRDDGVIELSSTASFGP